MYVYISYTGGFFKGRTVSVSTSVPPKYHSNSAEQVVDTIVLESKEGMGGPLLRAAICLSPRREPGALDAAFALPHPTPAE